MFKDTYDVQRGERRRVRRDTSYGSFLCALLIFLILCIIIIIVGNWSVIIGTHEKVQKDNSRYENINGNPNEKDLEFFQTFVVSPTSRPLTTRIHHQNSIPKWMTEYVSQPSTSTSATLTTPSSEDDHKTTPPVHPTTRISHVHPTTVTTTTSHSPVDTHVDINPLPPTRPSVEEMMTTRMHRQFTEDKIPEFSTRKWRTETEEFKQKPIPLTKIPEDLEVSHITFEDWSTESARQGDGELGSEIAPEDWSTAKGGRQGSDVSSEHWFKINAGRTLEDWSTINPATQEYDGTSEDWSTTYAGTDRFGLTASNISSESDISDELTDAGVPDSTMKAATPLLKSSSAESVSEGIENFTMENEDSDETTEDDFETHGYNSNKGKLVENAYDFTSYSGEARSKPGSLAAYRTESSSSRSFEPDSTEPIYQRRPLDPESTGLGSSRSSFEEARTHPGSARDPLSVDPTSPRTLYDEDRIEPSSFRDNFDSTSTDGSRLRSTTLSDIQDYYRSRTDLLGRFSVYESSSEDYMDTSSDNEETSTADQTGQIEFDYASTDQTTPTKEFDTWDETMSTGEFSTINNYDDASYTDDVIKGDGGITILDYEVTSDINEGTYRSTWDAVSGGFDYDNTSEESTSEDDYSSSEENYGDNDIRSTNLHPRNIGQIQNSTFGIERATLHSTSGESQFDVESSYGETTGRNEPGAEYFIRSRNHYEDGDSSRISEDSVTSTTNGYVMTKILDEVRRRNGFEGTTNNFDNLFMAQSTSYKLLEETASELPKMEEEPVCSTPECKSVGARMLSLMDDSQDACEDFYAFACGSSSSPSPSPPGYPPNSREWDILLEKTMQIKDSPPSHFVAFRSFYDSCVDFHYELSHKERIEKVKKILTSYGIETFELADACDINHIFKTLLSLNLMYFFEVGVDSGSAGVSSDIAYLRLGPSLVNPGEIGLWSALKANQKRCLSEQRRKIYGPDLNLEKMQASYTECLGEHTEFKQLLLDAVRAFGFDKYRVNHHYTTLYLDKLLKIRPTDNDAKQAKDGKPYSIQEIQVLFPAVNWTIIFSTWLQNNDKPNKFVNIYDLNYLTKWFQAFSGFTEKKWLLINMLITDLYYNFVVDKDTNDVERQCMKTTSTIFGDIASNLYLKHFSDSFIEEQGKRVDEQFALLKSKLTESFHTMNENENATTHLNKLTVVFTNRKYVPSDQKLEVKYKHFPSYATYQEYLLAAKIFNKYDEQYALSQMVNAFGNKPILSSVKIFIPLGMVADIPLDFPKHVTASKIGFKLAQAMVQTFSNLGLVNFMNEDSYETLVSNSNNFISYIERKLKFKVKLNAKFTINQRITDNAALRLLTDTYPEMKNDIVVPWISSSLPKDKVMFLSVAQEFCWKESPLDYMMGLREGGELPGAARIHNMFMNSDSFAKTFSCVDGSEMNGYLPRAQFPYFEPRSRV